MDWLSYLMGYVTLMAEDWDKGVFNWPGCSGFQKHREVTTHYMRPFQLRQKDKTKAMRETMNKDHCFEAHLYLNEYLEKFIRAYPDSPKASLIWASDLIVKTQFDNSFVFFMGDHGLRFGWYSKDPVGQRDVNNPMLMISVPRWLR
ncbi:hypothetical protein PMAYCL1PPCAC_13505, partial [Pristionchus mayeri]